MLGRMSSSSSPKLGSRLASMIPAGCILALGLLSSAALGGDVRAAEAPSGPKTPRTEFGEDEEPRTLERSDVSKRRAGLNGPTCTALSGVESALQNNTHTVSDLPGRLITPTAI